MTDKFLEQYLTMRYEIDQLDNKEPTTIISNVESYIEKNTLGETKVIHQLVYHFKSKGYEEWRYQP